MIAQKNRKATSVGLGDAAKIITNQLDAAKLAVLVFQKTETRKLEKYHSRSQSRPLLAGAEYEEVEEEVLDDESVGVEMEDVEPMTPM